MELRTKRVQWGKICIEVREESGLDVFNEPQLIWAVVEAVWGTALDDTANLSRTERSKLNSFVTMLSRTTSIEGLEMDWPHADSPKEQIKAAWETMDSLSGGLVRAWTSAIFEMASPPMGDPDLAPSESLPENKKKAQE